MPRSLQMYLADVRMYIQEIEEFTRGKTQQDFEREQMVRSAVRGDMILIGEAISQMPHHFPETNVRVGRARRIVDFRNLLIHDYGSIDDAILWSVVVESLPRLKAEIADWIGDSQQSVQD